MKRTNTLLIAAFVLLASCQQPKGEVDSMETKEKREVTAKDILGNPAYTAISYGGYRDKTRDIQPTVTQLKEDMKILSALDVKVLRTYNVHLPHASNVLKAIRELKQEDPEFEMYVMLGAWIDCLNAWTDKAPDHNQESPRNAEEIARAVELANEYKDIVKVVAVGNEAMVKWAESYYVQPGVILKWVNHLQNLKKNGELPADLWITSSDDFASWGGGDPLYHTDDLKALIRAVDYISMHTYPYHNTHYNPEFWYVTEKDMALSEKAKAEAAMIRSRDFAKKQYQAVKDFMKSVGVDKPVHIGETGWATVSNGHYGPGPDGSHASDEFKQALYYRLMREWTQKEGISCFYFEAFDEPWKDGHNPKGSENHFGLFTVDGQAKYVLWDLVDEGRFSDLSRGGHTIGKTFNGDTTILFDEVMAPPVKPKTEVK